MTDDAAAAPSDPRLLAAQIEKAEADARAARAAASKAEIELGDLDSLSGRTAREAKNAQAAAEAQQKVSEAGRAELSAMIPDFSKVTPGTLDVKDGPPMGGSALTFGALGDAADAIANAVLNLDHGAHKAVLVTSHEDLATADATYLQVTSGMNQLITAADRLLQETDLDAMNTEMVGALLPLVATLIPSVLSLLSTSRTVSGATVTMTDLAAATAVAGALEAKGHDIIEVWHDDFRLLCPGRVQTTNERLATLRSDLQTRKLVLAGKKSEADTDLALAKKQEEAAQKAFDETKPEDKAAREAVLTTARERVGILTRGGDAVTARAAAVDSLLSAIDAYVAAMHAVPAGATRSPYTTACLLDDLHEAAGAKFSHVVLVKALGGQASQVVENRAIFHDKIATFAEINVSYMVITTVNSQVVVAGTATAVKHAHGNIGSTFTVDPAVQVMGISS